MWKHSAAGNGKGAAAVGNSLALPQMVNYYSPLDPAVQSLAGTDPTESSQSQKTTLYMVVFIGSVENRKSPDRLVVASGGAGAGGRWGRWRRVYSGVTPRSQRDRWCWCERTKTLQTSTG